MNENPQGHFQMSCPMIKLKSSDGEIFEVQVKVAKLSSYIKNMLDDLGVEENEVIPIPQNAPQISGAILKKIIQWANHHKDDHSKAEDDTTQVKPTDGMSSWDAEFLQVDQSILFQMIRAADYLNINGLLDVTCKKLAKLTKGKSPEEVRRTFHIQNDFTPDEEKQVREENVYARLDNSKEMHFCRKQVVVGKIPASSVQLMQEESNDSSEVIQDCLNTSLVRTTTNLQTLIHVIVGSWPNLQHRTFLLQVLRKIFQHFTDQELLELSCVNKSWNLESRSVMKKRGKLLAHLACSDHCSRCKNTEVFGTVLRKMNVVPYSGIDINIDSEMRGHWREKAALDSTCEAIYTRLALEHLSVRLTGTESWNHKNCPAFMLAKKLLQDYSEVLKQLTLDIYESNVEFIKHVVQDCVFPQLSILKLLNSYVFYRPDESYTSYIKLLVSRAPNLKELHIDQERDLMKNVLEGTSAVLVYQPAVRYPFKDISDSVMSTIRLEKLQLFYTGYLNLEQLNQTIPLLLRAPCTSRLRELWIDEVLGVLLMCYGIPLENVKKIRMKICLAPVYPQILRILKDFDFTQIFPNLNEVSFGQHDHNPALLPHHVEIAEQANAVLREPNLERAANIKFLDAGFRALSNAPFFAEMFPSIEKLRIKEYLDEEIPFGWLWKHWVDLKELQVDLYGDQILNLDSVFCGIFPEEVAELRQMDDEYLQTVNIVPVMPAITGLKNLKTLKLKFDKLRWCHELQTISDDDTFVFSKVTRFLAFERCHSLTIGLQFWCNNGVFPAMRHLMPFTSVTFTFC